MSFKALLVGINAYESAPLRGCVNDATLMRDFISQRYGVKNDQIRLLTDKEATKAAISEGLRWLAQPDSEQGRDVRLFHFAGHGIFIPDENGDEPDGRDECLAPIDYQTAGPLTDDTLRETYSSFGPDTHLVLVMDCCHSGGNQRDIANDIVYRFVPSSEAEQQERERLIGQARERNRARKQQYVAEIMSDMLQRSVGSMSQEELQRQIAAVMDQFDKKHYGIEDIAGPVVLIAACRPDQTAADAAFSSVYHGALTYHLTDILNAAGGKLPYGQLIEKLGRAVAERFVQVPMLECASDRREIMFLQDLLG